MTTAIIIVAAFAISIIAALIVSNGAEQDRREFS
jgi:hypothetical protein